MPCAGCVRASSPPRPSRSWTPSGCCARRSSTNGPAHRRRRREGEPMLNDEQIRAAIVSLAKPIAERGGCNVLEADPHIIEGLAWALLGNRPRHGKLGDVRELQQFLETCGIPCRLETIGSRSEIRWDHGTPAAEAEVLP